jgi:hypothetical protein
MSKWFARSLGFVVVTALGVGLAWAGNALPRRSVGTEQLKRGAVTSPKVDNHTLTKKDLARGATDPGYIRRFGPIHMDALDDERIVLRIGPLDFVASCTLDQPDIADGEVELVTHVQHVSYRSDSDDYDEDLNPGEGAGWAQFDAFNTTGRQPPDTVEATAYLPDGRGIFGTVAMVRNTNPNRDCTFFGWFEIMG